MALDGKIRRSAKRKQMCWRRSRSWKPVKGEFVRRDLQGECRVCHFRSAHNDNMNERISKKPVSPIGRLSSQLAPRNILPARFSITEVIKRRLCTRWNVLRALNRLVDRQSTRLNNGTKREKDAEALYARKARFLPKRAGRNFGIYRRWYRVYLTIPCVDGTRRWVAVAG